MSVVKSVTSEKNAIMHRLVKTKLKKLKGDITVKRETHYAWAMIDR
jgi:hypothetical protein